MAIRRCGKVQISCVFVDRTDNYRCSISVAGKKRETSFIGRPATMKIAVDSPEAYDDTAHAAIAFALHDGVIDDSEVEFAESGSGYIIRRGTPKKR